MQSRGGANLPGFKCGMLLSSSFSSMPEAASSLTVTWLLEPPALSRCISCTLRFCLTTHVAAEVHNRTVARSGQVDGPHKSQNEGTCCQAHPVCKT